MNIDFHYGMIYVVSRLAGLNKQEANTVAHSCQYIDDSTVDGVLSFSGGQAFNRIASAHKLVDYRNALDVSDRKAWAPFHFLPGGEGDSFEDKAICKPNSDNAKQMVRHAILEHGEENALHRLGVTLHVYIDTWAHQGFSGIISDYNKVTHLEGEGYNHDSWLGELKNLTSVAEDEAASSAIDKVSKVGHGAALHFPDWPWAQWKYTNGHDQNIERNNLQIFIEAADMACRAIQGFQNKNSSYESEVGLSEGHKQALTNLVQKNQDHDENNRLNFIKEQVAQGAIPGLQEDIPLYVGKGPGSWKDLAIGVTSEIDDGLTQPEWSEAFEQSDYRKYHEAVKEHFFVVTQVILPESGIRLI